MATMLAEIDGIINLFQEANGDIILEVTPKNYNNYIILPIINNKNQQVIIEENNTTKIKKTYTILKAYQKITQNHKLHNFHYMWETTVNFSNLKHYAKLMDCALGNTFKFNAKDRIYYIYGKTQCNAINMRADKKPMNLQYGNTIEMLPYNKVVKIIPTLKNHNSKITIIDPSGMHKLYTQVDLHQYLPVQQGEIVKTIDSSMPYEWVKKRDYGYVLRDIKVTSYNKSTITMTDTKNKFSWKLPINNYFTLYQPFMVNGKYRGECTWYPISERRQLVYYPMPVSVKEQVKYELCSDSESDD